MNGGIIAGKAGSEPPPGPTNMIGRPDNGRVEAPNAEPATETAGKPTSTAAGPVHWSAVSIVVLPSMAAMEEKSLDTPGPHLNGNGHRDENRRHKLKNSFRPPMIRPRLLERNLERSVNFCVSGGS